MPELPEVETVRRGLEGAVVGATISSVTLRRSNLRTSFPDGFIDILTGRTIVNVARRAKYLLFYLESDLVLLAHLGMTGKFSVIPVLTDEALSPHDHVIFVLNDGRRLIYNDTRRFGLMDICTVSEVQTHKLLAHLGPEPLEDRFTAEYLKKALQKRNGPIKPAIMDQKIVVGVGNIYASEALFLSKISPLRPANGVGREIPLFIASIHEVLGAAIKAGGSTLRDFAHLSGESGYFQHTFQVYGRKGEPCSQCRSPIVAIRQAGRATYYCEKCQK